MRQEIIGAKHATVRRARMFTLRAARVKAGDCYGSPSYLAGRNLDSLPPGPELALQDHGRGGGAFPICDP